MLLCERNGLTYLQFPNLAGLAGIWHGIFTRQGGCSPAPYDSLNVSMGVGDRSENVLENRRRILDCSGGSELVFTNQIHGVKVLALKKGDVSDVAIDKKPTLEGDALITDIRGKALVIKVADCQAVMMVDSVRHVTANVHSGWRGSIHNIIAKTIDIMKATFGCRPENIHAGVGPSLGPCCGEFINYKKEIPDVLWKYRVGKVHFDFWALSRDQLCNAGVSPENICLSNSCTKCNTDRYFSYRGEGETGRSAAVITLK
ncbi:MAG: peptidoglycan editing factor PgeF [Thermodesulfobacteriota bacterium]